MTEPQKRRGLGRGLSALLPDSPPASATPATRPREPALAVEPAPTTSKRTYFFAAIEDVYPSPEQPRRRFDDGELEELAVSIRAHGVIQPLIVRARPAASHARDASGYFLIAGERRWRAAQRAGLREIPVVVQDVDDREAFERALVENLQRSDLNPIEEAEAYQRLVADFGLTQEAIAERVGKERSTVANALRLLRLPTGVRAMVEDGRLAMGHARALLGLDAAPDIESAAREIAARGLSVRATEDLVRKRSRPASEAGAARPALPAAKTPAVRDLEERLTRALGAAVEIHDEPGKGGAISVRYLDLDHLDRLLERLLG